MLIQHKKCTIYIIYPWLNSNYCKIGWAVYLNESVFADTIIRPTATECSPVSAHAQKNILYDDNKIRDRKYISYVVEKTQSTVCDIATKHVKLYSYKRYRYICETYIG